MKRYELKYYLNEQQLQYFKDQISRYMKIDKYGLTSIASIYFDTPDYRLITKSIEKPNYKEKLRLRSYGLASKKTKTFLEIKRKCGGFVYKRRISLLEDEANTLISSKESNSREQISREPEAFMKVFNQIVNCKDGVIDEMESTAKEQYDVSALKEKRKVLEEDLFMITLIVLQAIWTTACGPISSEANVFANCDIFFN